MVRAIVFAWVVWFSSPAFAGIIGFESLNFYSATGPTGSYYNGDLGSQTTNSNGWSSEGVSFSNSYTFDPFFGGFWSGTSYSNVVDPNTSGFQNQYASRPGSGADGSSQYAVAFNAFRGDTVVTFGTDVNVDSMSISNNAYAYFSMLNGDGFAKQFGGASGNDPDFLLLRIFGMHAGATTGSTDFYLADYRSADNSKDYIVSNWAKVNLASLGVVDSLQFEMQSSDVGQFGINTPTYFVMDNILISPVPEPTSLALLAIAGMSAYAMRYRRRRCPGCMG